MNSIIEKIIGYLLNYAVIKIQESSSDWDDKILLPIIHYIREKMIGD